MKWKSLVRISSLISFVRTCLKKKSDKHNSIENKKIGILERVAPQVTNNHMGDETFSHGVPHSHHARGSCRYTI
jgi:hypothetical protein